MASPEWYYAKNDTQYGPISAAELKRLAEGGQLGPSDLIWRQGMEEWVAAGKVKGLFEDSPAAPPKAAGPPAKMAPPEGAALLVRATAAPQPARPQPSRHLFDHFLRFARRQFTVRFVDLTSRIFTGAGHYGLYLAMALLLALGLMLGVKTSEVNLVLLGVGGVVILTVLQYASSRFFGALDRLNRSTPARMSSPAFLDCYALLHIFGGLVALLGLTLAAVETEATESLSLILPALATFILAQYVAALALNPESLHVTIESQTTAGEEAIGVLSFLVKLSLKIVPVAFGVGIVWGTILLLVAAVLLFLPGDRPADASGSAQPEKVERVAASPKPPGSQPLADAEEADEESPPVEPTIQTLTALATAYDATRILILFAALPFLTYVLFLLYYLLVDVLRAVLAIPRKLDELTEEEEMLEDP